MDKAYLVREVKSFLMDEDGVGVIELVLILVEIYIKNRYVFNVFNNKDIRDYISAYTVSL